MTQTRRAPLALLIDDAAAPRIIRSHLREVTPLGSPVVKRIYGDWTTPNFKGWKLSLRDFAIHPIQQLAQTLGRNATDGAMIIDTMHMLHTARFSGFCIVSSDHYFSRHADPKEHDGT
ncbi:NYN domain-containing protein [Pararhizobium sp. DWP1-1-3]|uniref:NYN domain-containing protein n=1 Tax=Pararhizobium sp. DWP1-1-3 TaxID=2804652 RepID=UPI003CED523E